MLIVRAAQPADLPAIHALHVAAFSRTAEADLAALLHQRGLAVISLVATESDSGEIIGHILFSPVTLDPTPSPTIRILGLAPLAVLPARQSQGIGAALVHAGISACKSLGNVDTIILLGHPTYYPTFGFQRASGFGLSNIYGADEAFMALELTAGALDGVEATAHFAPEFAEAGC